MMALKILVADDEIVMRELLKTVLSDQGHDVITVPNGIEALSALKNEPFNLVITDLQMGFISGMDVIREAKRLDPGTIVFLMTGSRDINNQIECYQLGADAFLAKPMDINELIALIQFNTIKYFSSGFLGMPETARSASVSG